MGVVLDVFLNVLLLGSLAVYLFVLFYVTLRTEDRAERFIRVTALFAGAMIVVATQASGVTYANFIVDAIAKARPGVALLSAVIPALGGAALGAYGIHVFKRRGEAVGMRFLALIGMLGASSFLSIYVASMSNDAKHLRPAAVPNMAFVVGLILYVIFNWKTASMETQPPSRLSRFGDALIERVRPGARAGKPAPPSDPTPTPTAPTASALHAFRQTRRSGTG
jgi:hypothetical protein